MTRGAGVGRPTGRFDGVPPALRRLWSLLYRATRRHAVRIDQLYGFVTSVTGRHRGELDVLRARVDGLDVRSTDLAALLGAALARVDDLEARVGPPDARVDEARS